ncbi:hypothetical protein CFC21_024877 [Triticum aestivum]|uniref:Subtilisin-like protease n=2 Tax=Triticum aestivum TaxID=4565 RepID=A0A3B6CAY0_WHEAT|nr:subtilisin-like protease 1 [Triticum dicoccoides]XP_044320283.1 subtilisin-like protease 1 [Triticum aestivum]KAF7010463.1 hypothetical protein CFC21_024877 [Triticum aestivum]
METTRLSLLSLLPFLLLAIAAAATGGELSTFIVHVQAEETHVFGTADDRKAWYHSFLPEHGRLVHAYHHVASGFAARLTRRELEAVSAMPGFLSATRARTYTTLTTHTPEFLGLNLEQGRRNYTSEFGAGVIVGVIDTGIFPDHPSFSDDGMPPPPAKWKGRCDFSGTSCNNKLIGARNMVAALNGPNGTSARVPPVDEFGHGTHTASTAAGAVVPGANVLGHAWGTAAGMAVRAHIAVYKVCYGNVVVDCEDADILAGIDAAVGDGCDVISMSLGGPSVPFHQNPMAIGTFGAMEKGIFVSMAAGNSGPGESTVINEAPWMLTVAAGTMDRSIRSTVQLGNGAYFQGESLYQPNVGFCPLVYAGASGKPFAEFCGNGSLDGFDVKGKIVLCELTKNISVINQGEVVESAGGVAMILASPFFRGYDKLAQANILPASSVDYLSAAAIKSYLNSTANPVARMGFRGTLLGTSPAPSIIFFSSRGPSRQDTGVLKPDITGPGMNVLAAWPFQVGPPSAPVLPGPTFNMISGTSMSTPHLAGIAALIKSKHPDWSPAAIKSAMMTTADITDRSGNPILNEQRVAANLFATGAGHVNPMKAADPGLVYDITPEDYIGYLCSMYTSQQVSVIARRPINCLTTVVISDCLLNYPSISVAFPASWNSTALVVVRRKVKNVGEVPSVYYAAIDMPSSAVSVDVFPRELEFVEPNQELTFSVYVWPRQSDARVLQGALRWVSEKHTVRSPISITFA